jgi:glycosyltransferase involved in cell wall biosynthesis
MKVLVATTMVPFVHGGAEELCTHLVRNLALQGVEAEALRLPFSWDPAERLIEEMLIARSLRLYNVDRLIALKFPAYLIAHPNKVVWLLHQYRQAYDLYDAGETNLAATHRGQQIRSSIWQADKVAFGEARAIYTNGPNTAQRLRRYNGFQSVVLPPPVNDPELFVGGASEGYIFAGGRVNAHKRQTLLVQALHYAPSARLVIAGPPDSAEDAAALRRLVSTQGVDDRVYLDLRLLSREELASFVNRCAAVAYLPYDEDSLGYLTMEAFQAGKPVITTSDSGGVLEAVHHNKTGLVARPSAQSLGAALRRIVRNPTAAATMGLDGRSELEAKGLNWPTVINKLLS